jgi:hypothetical protein
MSDIKINQVSELSNCEVIVEVVNTEKLLYSDLPDDIISRISGAVYLDELLDVDTSSVLNYQYLIYDSGSSNWIATNSGIFQNIKIDGSLFDGTNSAGISGQILTSLGSGSYVQWADFTNTGTSGTISGSGITNYLSKFTTETDINESIIYQSGANIGIGTTAPSYKLHVAGSFSATSKSFTIKHPNKPNSILVYGSLESPYHGIRLTGKDKLLEGRKTIKLPHYIRDLVKEEGVHINITNYGHFRQLAVLSIDISQNSFTIMGEECEELDDIEFFWDFTAIRKDIEDLEVEVEQ